MKTRSRSHRPKRFHAAPDYLSAAPAQQFADLDTALRWAGRVARRWRVPFSVVEIGTGGRSVRRHPVDPR